MSFASPVAPSASGGGASVDGGEEDPIGLTVRPGQDCSILSTLLHGHDSIEVPYEHPLIRFFTMREATQLRLVHPEVVVAVATARFDGNGRDPPHDLYFGGKPLGGNIKVPPGPSGAARGQFASWRACFPMAVCLWVGSQAAFTDALAAAPSGYLSTLRVYAVNVSNMIVGDVEAAALTEALFHLGALETLHFDVFDTLLSSSRSIVCALVAALRKFVTMTCVRQSACCALNQISSLNETCQLECVSAGAVPALVAALRADAFDAKVSQDAIGALGSILSSWLVAEDAYINAGVAASIVDALHAHSSNVEVARCACWALSNFSDYIEGRKEAFNAGAVPALVAALRAFPFNVGIARHASSALENFASMSEGENACLAAGAVSAVVAALRACSSDADAASSAIWALNRMSTCDAGLEACVEAGAVAAILTAFVAMPSSEELCVRACATLSNMARSPSGLDACLAAGVAGVVVNALVLHNKESVACDTASVALTSLADSPAGQKACFEACAVPALLKALRTHLCDEGVVARVFGALTNTSFEFPAGQEACVEAIPEIVAALRIHRFEEGVCRTASGLIWNISASSAAREACVRAAVLADLAHILTYEAGVFDQEVCHNVSGALCAIAESPADKAAAVSAGAVAHLVARMTTEADSATFFEEANAALLNVVSVPSGREAALPAVPLLVAAIARHGVTACPSAHATLAVLGFSDSGILL